MTITSKCFNDSSWKYADKNQNITIIFWKKIIWYHLFFKVVWLICQFNVLCKYVWNNWEQLKCRIFQMLKIYHFLLERHYFTALCVQRFGVSIVFLYIMRIYLSVKNDEKIVFSIYIICLCEESFSTFTSFWKKSRHCQK